MGAIIGPVARPIIQPVVRYDSGVLPWERRDDGERVFLLDYALATYSRNIEASFYDPRTGLFAASGADAWKAANVPRIFSDGSVLLEGARMNRLLASRDNTDAARWPNPSSGATITGDAGVGPDGAMLGDRVQAAGAQFSRGQTPTGAANPHVISAFGRAFSVSSKWVANYVAGTAWNTTVTEVWTRMSFVRTGAASIYYPVDSSLPSGSPQDVLVDLHQAEDGSFASSPIRTTTATVTRLGSLLSFPSIPVRMRSGKWRLRIYLPHSSGAINFTVLAQGAAATDEVGYGNASGRLTLTQGGVVKVQSNVLSWNAGTTLTLTFDAVAGSIDVQGATSGNGTVVGASWVWPNATTHIGVRSNGLNPAYAVFYRPEPA